MFNITDEEIRKSEDLFLPQDDSFDPQRRNVIRCLTSEDVQACPGSGKTTALLAKLSILALKMPFPNNKGICVLTHTNVAINEIKERLGLKGNILFSYPSFFGTIQAFVDRFLAIPAYIHYYGRRPSRIDSEYYNFEIERAYRKLAWKSPLRKWLYVRSQTTGATPEELLKSIKYDYVSETFIDSLNSGIVLLGNKDNDTFKQLFEIRESILKQGILSYDDAYSLSFRYLNEAGDKIKSACSERFHFLFIDEMQDTAKYQINLINSIFDRLKVIIQRVGDINQSIFNSVREENTWDVKDEYLEITGSKRFSNAIAERVSSICISPQKLTGNAKIPNIAPKIIVFTDEKIQDVLKKFGELIIDNNLHLEKRKVFKAVGWVGKEKGDNHTLPSYFTGYNKTMQVKKLDFENLKSYLQPASDDVISKQGVNFYRKLLIRAILRLLRLLEIKDEKSSFFSESTFLKYLNESCNLCYDTFLNKLAEWCMKMHNCEDIKEDVKSFILSFIIPAFKANLNKEAENFLNSELVEFQKESNTACKPDVFKYCSKGAEVNIEVSTIHSVKGETHTATLYLETYYKGYDIKRIIEYLKGRYSKASGLKISTLKMAYVGMTRPTHLLCVAAHKSSVDKHEKTLATAGWEIIEL